MKKLVILIIIFLTGCTNEDITFDNHNYKTYDTYYNVATPYKVSVNKEVIYKLNNIEISNISSELNFISLDYFDNKRYFIENGQYIDYNEMKKYIENTSIIHIVEKNFINNDGKLSGVSLGFVFNKIDLEKDKDLIEAISSEIRKNNKLEGIDFLISLYEISSTDYKNGNYIYKTFFSGNTISKYEITKHSNLIFPSLELSNNDIKNYNNFIKIKDEIKNIDEKINIIGKGFYVDKNLKKLNIEIDLLTDDDELKTLVSTVIANNLYLFNSNVYVVINVNDEIVSSVNYSLKDKKSIINFY